MKQIGIVFVLPLTLAGSLLLSQSAPATKPAEYDHIAIHVRDLQKSAEFYEKVMGLEKLAEPFKDGRHLWFRMGPHSQLHIVSGAVDLQPHQIDDHFAFRVPSMAAFTAHLEKMQVKYRSFKGDDKVTIRPDGVRQVYLQDPDGYWIEVNDGSF